LEYCCCWLPMNPQAVVEAVAKSLIKPEELKFVGCEVPKQERPAADPFEELMAKARFTPIGEIEKAINAEAAKIDWKKKVQKTLDDAIDRMKGKI
jgi:hypothetical protein